ncbi:tetraspanin-33-like [Rhipicephalus microplus]|uniref:tetraspanin-33-like n=1 Tax=Rhipicephalus microplus TaxID=6941 RepID=UPI003F6AB3D5
MEVLLFLFGLALFTISSCGCVGALRENTFLLRVDSFALTILIVVNFVLGVLVYIVPGSMKSVIKTTMSEKLVVHYRDSQDFHDLVDAMQRYLKCCGMTSRNFRDWNDNIVLNLSDHEAWFRVHTGSCPDATNRYVKEHVMIIGGVCLVAVIVLAFIDMVTNAVIDEIDIIRKIYDHINGAEAGVSSAFTT